jgi:hypothetical protein
MKHEYILTREFLEKEYLINKKTVDQIAKQVGCKHLQTIYYYLKKFNIQEDRKTLDVSGMRSGSLTAIRKNGYRNKQVLWLCQCDCGNTCDATACAINKRTIKSCGCRSFMLGNKHHNYTGYEEITGRVWNTIKQRAKTDNKEFSITIEYAWELFKDSNRKCCISELDIYFPKLYNDKYTASLDRIDSSKGYVEGNVWWVHHDINIIKWDWSLDDFYKMCKCVSEFKQSNMVEQKELPDIKHSIWSNILYKANERGILVEIDYDYVNNLYKKQGGLCYISGLTLVNHCRAGKRTASLDRIDSTTPYIEGNVAWCHKKVNSGKNNFSLEYFRELCKLVAKHRKTTNG